MDASDLTLNIDYVGTRGIVLSPEYKAALQTSLGILKNNYKFDRVYYWGKICGIKDDYFIAQGVMKDEHGKKSTLYSKDCIRWGLLPPATPEMRANAKLAKGRFTGDPSFEFEHTETKKTGEGEDAVEEEEMITIKEENRLTAVIAEIDNDVRIVPRGGFIKTPTGEVFPNRSFEGLTVTEASKLCNYLHFRAPERLQEKSLLQKADLDPSFDFMDSIDEDIPKGGAWCLQFERGSGQVYLISLLWPGYVFYHLPGTKKFGSIYVGTGEKNMDLPFML